MATTVVTLKQGWKIGSETATEVCLCEPTAGDVIDAATESERIVPVAGGYQLVQSPTLAGINILRRQIERVGGYDGVVTMDMIRKLGVGDLQLLQAAAEALSSATMEAVEARGRDDPPAGGAGP